MTRSQVDDLLVRVGLVEDTGKHTVWIQVTDYRTVAVREHVLVTPGSAAGTGRLNSGLEGR